MNHRTDDAYDSDPNDRRPPSREQARNDDGNPPPPRVMHAGAEVYTALLDLPKLTNRKVTLIATMEAIVIVALAFAIFRMLPLRQRVPYFLTINQATGQVSAADNVAQRFTPTEATERYFLKQWAVNLLQIDDSSAKERLPASYAILRGSALGEWNHFVFDVWKPLDRLKQNPGLREYPKVDSVAFIGDDTAVLHVSLHDAAGNYGNAVIVTVKYAILPVTTEAQVNRNPIGLWITHFSVSNESASQQ